MSLRLAIPTTALPFGGMTLYALGQKQRFRWRHSLSVPVTLGHIGASGWLLARMA